MHMNAGSRPYGPPRLLAGALGQAQPAVVARAHWAPQFQGERRFRRTFVTCRSSVKDPTTMKSMCRNQYEAGPAPPSHRAGVRRP